LFIFGVVFCLVFPLAMFWPSGWAWHQGPPYANDYFMMIVAVYFVLGIFLIRAARDPAANASLIWFTVWSSVAHALVMASQAMSEPMQQGHLMGDVPALLLVAIVLGGLMMSARSNSTAMPAD
jgi:uncharacterized membrane protein SirB2